MDIEKDISSLFKEFHMKQFSVLDVQEKERQRIARDLHDSSLQDLIHLIHKVELCSLYIDEDPVKAKLELVTMETGLRKVVDDIRNRIYDLRSMTFDDLGLRDSLLNLFSLLNLDGSFEILADIDEIENDLTDEKKQVMLIMLYRIIQECVQNALKHSKGDQIKVRLKENDTFYFIEVKDNGVGFDLAKAAKKDKHFGLLVVRERVFLLNGKMHMETKDGTSIEIEIPKEK